MAKVQAVVCDMTKGFMMGIPGVPPCNKLAKGECDVCERDICEDHLVFKLRVTIATVAPSRQGQNQQQEAILPCVDRTDELTTCSECHAFIFDAKNRKRGVPDFDTATHTRALLDAVVAEIRAARATFTLTEPTK